MLNRYAGTCSACGGPVPAKGGKLQKSGRRWEVYHLDCNEGRPGVDVVTFASGHTITRNRNGLCEDAPCCGCCTG